MELASLLLTLLLLALPIVLLLPLYSMGRRKANEQLAPIEPLLFQWGFQRASWFEQARERFLYKTSKSAYPIYISLKDLHHGKDAQRLLSFLVFLVELPVKDNFFIRASDMESEENDILYETYVKRLPSDVLAPLGLRTLCAPASRSDLERRLLSEPAQGILAVLTAQKDLFYIYGDAEYGFLQFGFALPRSPEPQRIRRWLEAAIGLARILHDPTRQGQVKRNQQLTWLWLIFLFLCILLVSLFLFVPILGGLK